MRIFWIKIFFLILFFCLIVRLFYWQVVSSEYLQSQAEKQYFTDVKVKALRGNIFFNYNSILVSTNPSFSIFGQPKLLSKEQKINNGYLLAKVLAENTDEVDGLAKDFIEKLSRDLYWVSLKKQISFEKKKQIEDLNLPGIGFEQTSNRFYPEGSSSANLLGFLGYDAKGDNKGYFGIEGYYDGELRGMSGLIRHEKDA